jgi:hypothetical protein
MKRSHVVILGGCPISGDAWHHDRSFSFDRRIHLRGPAARINQRFPALEIEFRSDARRVSANLQALQLNSLDILGHASQIRLALSKPVSTAYIYIAGGADQIRVIRPHGTGLRIQLHDGATQVSFDEQHFNAIVGEALLESKDYPNSASRYDISIAVTLTFSK